MDVNDLLLAIRRGELSSGTAAEGPTATFAGSSGTDISPEGTASPNSGAAPRSTGPLGSILDAILGGAQSQRPGGPTMPPQGGGPLGGILDAILGGSASHTSGGPPNVPSPRRSNPAGGILDVLLGGGGINSANNSVLSPIAGLLSKKFGIPQAAAMVIVGFAVTKLLAAQVNGGKHGGFDVGRLMEQLNSRDGVTPNFAADSGMAEELAAGTGIGAEQAAQMLQEVYNQLGAQTASVPGTSSAGMDTPRPEAARTGTGERARGGRGARRRR